MYSTEQIEARFKSLSLEIGQLYKIIDSVPNVDLKTKNDAYSLIGNMSYEANKVKAIINQEVARVATAIAVPKP
ncbi:MAG: hypothetical protein V4538_01590 [Bacteroidota bacterium]